MTVSKTIIVGNLGKDPEMRYTPGGQAVTNFSIAANRVYTRSNGEKVKETTWFRASCWGKLAETANNWLSQGDQIYIEGRIKPDPETGGPRIYNRQDGSAASNFEIDVERLVFLTIARSSSRSETGNVNEEEVPF